MAINKNTDTDTDTGTDTSKQSSDLENLSLDWERFYLELFGITTDLSDVEIPEKENGYDRLIIVAQGMTPEKVFAKYKESFPFWTNIKGNLDDIIQSERNAQNGAYAVWFKDAVEADENLRNLSANDLKKRNILGITFEERILMHLKFFSEKGKNLDVETITLCAGSSIENGRFPCVNMSTLGFNVPDSHSLIVSFCYDTDSGFEWRSRRAIL